MVKGWTHDHAGRHQADHRGRNAASASSPPRRSGDDGGLDLASIDQPRRLLSRPRRHRHDHPGHDGRGDQTVRRGEPRRDAALPRTRRRPRARSWSASAIPGPARCSGLAAAAMAAGAAGVMVAPISTLRTEEQVVRLFHRHLSGPRPRRARSSCRTFPSSTGVHLSVGTIEQDRRLLSRRWSC